MWSVLAFWLLLWLPGAVWLRRVLPELWAGGVPVWLTAAYGATFTLLAPVALLGYLLALPLWVLSATSALLIVAALLYLLWQAPRLIARARRLSWGSVCSPVAVLAAGVCALELYLSARTGSHFGGDGGYHAARIRSLLDNGFNIDSPLWPNRVERVYVGNLYHALSSVSAQLAGVAPTTAWACLFPVAKLLSSGGCAALAYALSKRSAAAWVVMATTMVYWGPQSMLAYPNMLAPMFGVGMATALWCMALQSAAMRPFIYAVGAAALLTAAIHPLYGVFLVLMLGPTTLLWVAASAARRPHRRRSVLPGLWLLLALSLALPHAAVGRFLQDPPSAQTYKAHPWPLPPESLEPQQVAAVQPKQRILRQLPGERWAVPLARSVQVRNLSVFALIGLLWWAIRSTAGRVMLGAAATLMVALHVPLVCTWLVQQAGAAWIVARLTVLLDLLRLALAPAFFVSLATSLFKWRAGKWTGNRLLMQVVPVGMLAAGVCYGYRYGVDLQPWSRAAYLDRLATPGSLEEHLDAFAARRVLLQRAVPAGSVLGVHPRDDYQLVMLHSVYPLAVHPARGDLHVKDMVQRRVDALQLLRGIISPTHLAMLLRHYDIHFVWTRVGTHAKQLCKRYGDTCVKAEVAGQRGLVRYRP